MKKAFVMVAMAGMCVMMVGCAGFQGPQVGGVGLGFLAGDTTYPGGIMTTTKVTLDADDFEIMQTVTAESYSESVMGLVSSGDSGYGSLFAKAKSIGADDVINIKIDTNQKRFVMGLYTKSTTMLTGTAIRWKKK
jgi:uncharacterized protein YbjQ (UPF0145 family)